MQQEGGEDEDTAVRKERSSQGMWSKEDRVLRQDDK